MLLFVAFRSRYEGFREKRYLIDPLRGIFTAVDSSIVLCFVNFKGSFVFVI